MDRGTQGDVPTNAPSSLCHVDLLCECHNKAVVGTNVDICSSNSFLAQRSCLHRDTHLQSHWKGSYDHTADSFSSHPVSESRRRDRQSKEGAQNQFENKESISIQLSLLILNLEEGDITLHEPRSLKTKVLPVRQVKQCNSGSTCRWFTALSCHQPAKVARLPGRADGQAGFSRSDVRDPCASNRHFLLAQKKRKKSLNIVTLPLRGDARSSIHLETPVESRCGDRFIRILAFETAMQQN